MGRGSSTHVRPLNCQCNAGESLDSNGNLSWCGEPTFSDVESGNVRRDKIIPYFLVACLLTTKIEEVLH